MKRNLSKYWLVTFLTAIAAVVVFQVSQVSPIENKRLFAFPSDLGEWKAQEIVMDKYIYKSLETPYAFLRDYYSNRFPFPVNLSIVWFDDHNIAIHAPESCLGGVGNIVKEKGTARIRLKREYEVNRLMVESNHMRQMVLYFYDEDGYITTSQSALRWRVLLKRLQFKRSSVSFIRLMAPIPVSEKETLDAMQVFLSAVYPFIPEYTYIDRISRKDS
jgi:EpsI family protein